MMIQMICLAWNALFRCRCTKTWPHSALTKWASPWRLLAAKRGRRSGSFFPLSSPAINSIKRLSRLIVEAQLAELMGALCSPSTLRRPASPVPHLPFAPAGRPNPSLKNPATPNPTDPIEWDYTRRIGPRLAPVRQWRHTAPASAAVLRSYTRSWRTVLLATF